MNANAPFADLPSPLDLAEAVSNVSAQSQAMLKKFFEGHSTQELSDIDPAGILPAFAAFTESLSRDPSRLLEAQFNAWNTYMQIWQSTAQRMFGMAAETVVPTPKEDKRFKSEDWDKNPLFDYIKQTYLATAGLMQGLVAGADGMDDKTAKKLEFYTKQYLDAIAPTNFALTNPQVLHATVETGGRNLLDGLKNFLADIDPKDGKLKTRMVDTSAFELGKNVAISPGKIVYQNELMQLIQYSPSTAEVYRRPLLIIPPWINKYYILDLQPKNSFIKWAVDQGLTVFVISWVNPDESLAEMDFDDYVRQGPLAALDAIEQATGERSVNVIGYCLGGTLLGATLALMQARGDERINAATFFTAMLDFAEPGDLGVFIDEGQLKGIEQTMQEKGFLDGAEMATTFNMLRANDLIWSFVVNNYLLGKQPMAFDLLYWNSDSTRMPARMHSTYLRKMYLENQFCKPQGMKVDGTPIDLRQVRIPTCFVSAVEDHIAPWKSTYAGARLFQGPVKFILGKAGHVAGIINPPGPRQYGYFTGPTPSEMTAEEWLRKADAHEASWWHEWTQWVSALSGDKVPARIPGAGTLKVIEDAPGSYVARRLSA
ncbi:MAG: class I poly(R)-hydroxyalkanoic acid synthase [Gammaproteobacteria bacterium]|nr:class I poly(R)-hydroxyalkanoic acid synthase [Gammaproteobacteria bacterium]